MSKILIMLELQQKLNDNTNGKGWENGLTAQGKKIDWRRCIYLEAAELVESYPWKHWKNIDAKVDTDNVKVELVDIWHFVMSEVLRVNALGDARDLKELASDIEASIANENVEYLQDYYAQIEAIEELIEKLFCNFELVDFTATFFRLCEKLGLGFDELYSLYIGKNILNIFRQDHGYKDGTYIKVWNGKEDNVVMQEILANNSNIGVDELYKELEKRYPKS